MPANEVAVAPVCAVSPASDTRLSDTLDVLASGCAGDNISFDDLTATLGDKCYAGLLFLLAAPNLVPLPPLTDAVLAAPLILLSAQLALGVRRPWLPDLILRREISTERFAQISARLEPMTRRAERLLRRRGDALTGILGRRVVGLACLVLAIVLALPIPLGNVGPAAAISLFALGLLTRDGMAVAAGAVATVATGLFFLAMSYGAVEAGSAILGQLRL